MMTKDLVENLGFYRYKDIKGNLVYVMINGSTYKFPIELHKMDREYFSFKDIFGEIE